ncbi:MAG TPA: DUF3105 domain-containing protein [Frankiaceae bacterium]|nr:DUF3105 domain-containing protein [Frankiaceae bacterium]
MAKRTPENDRRRLIEEQRKKARAQERRKTVATIVICTVLGALLIGASVYFGTKGGGKGDSNLAMRDVGLASEAAACSPVKEEEVTGESTHVSEPVQYNPAPPTSGSHNPTWLPVGRKRFYSRDDNPMPEMAVHNLEHAYVVVWYDSRATDEQLDRLRDAADAAKAKFLVVPWTRGDFTGEKHIVLTAWGFRQECSDVSGAVIDDFIKAHGGQAGKAPEKNAL